MFQHLFVQEYLIGLRFYPKKLKSLCRVNGKSYLWCDLQVFLSEVVIMFSSGAVLFNW